MRSRFYFLDKKVYMMFIYYIWWLMIHLNNSIIPIFPDYFTANSDFGQNTLMMTLFLNWLYTENDSSSSSHHHKSAVFWKEMWRLLHWFFGVPSDVWSESDHSSVSCLRLLLRIISWTISLWPSMHAYWHVMKVKKR